MPNNLKDRINDIHNRLQNAQRALHDLLDCQHVQEAAPMGDTFTLVDVILTRKSGGLNHWAILKLQPAMMVELTIAMYHSGMLLEELEQLLVDVRGYHRDDPRLRRQLVNPVCAQLELAIGSTRLAWCELAALVEDEGVNTFLVPVTIMDGASC